MDIRPVSELEPSQRRLIEVVLWLWVGGITVAYLHQFLFVLPLILSIFD